MRLAISIVLALVVTLALFWFMQYLITGGDKDILVPEPPLSVEIVRVKRDEEVDERKREPPRPPEQQDRPPPPPMEQMQTARPNLGSGVSMPRIETSTGLGGLGPMQEGDAIPVATIPPQYPVDAQRNGIEGWVRVQFTINPDGSVSNPEIIDAFPRRGIFDREALRAISRWRFRARVEGGEPVVTHGARYTIEFEMDTGGR